MRKIAAGLLLVAFANSYAIAGTVDFGPAQEIVLESGTTEVGPGLAITFPVSIATDALQNIVSTRVLFESTDLFLAPPTGSERVGQFALNPSQGSGFEADGRVGIAGPGAPPGFEAVGFLGNFGIDTFIDLQGTTSGRGIDFQTVNTDGVDTRLFLSATPGEPIFIGSLTVDAVGLGEGTYRVEVSGTPSALSGISGEVDEQLFGTATLNVTPEPATLALLGLGGLVALRRRRRTA